MCVFLLEEFKIYGGPSKNYRLFKGDLVMFR
jgi:hypothetical protein